MEERAQQEWDGWSGTVLVDAEWLKSLTVSDAQDTVSQDEKQTCAPPPPPLSTFSLASSWTPLAPAPPGMRAVDLVVTALDARTFSPLATHEASSTCRARHSPEWWTDAVQEYTETEQQSDRVLFLTCLSEGGQKKAQSTQHSCRTADLTSVPSQGYGVVERLAALHPGVSIRTLAEDEGDGSYGNPSAGRNQHGSSSGGHRNLRDTSSLDSIRGAVQKTSNQHANEDGSSSRKQTSASECFIDTPLAALRSGRLLYVLYEHRPHTLTHLLINAPDLVHTSDQQCFIAHQMMLAVDTLHSRGIPAGRFSTDAVFVNEHLSVTVRVALTAHPEDWQTESKAPTAADATSNRHRDEMLMEEDEQADTSLADATYRWTFGQLSNFDYLMKLNAFAGRRMGDPNLHPILPWVVDFSAEDGGGVAGFTSDDGGEDEAQVAWRDLGRTKYRLNKGDMQLDATFNSHLPHHISEWFTELTFFLYRARRTPRPVLCTYVRRRWEPNEYPASMARLYSFTPDECIPEFFTDPSIFRSIHTDMPDLALPPWADTPEQFVHRHRELLESAHVSRHLHRWIDLCFGYLLSNGTEAVAAKNVHLQLTQARTSLTHADAPVQIFEHPHPPRVVGDDHEETAEALLLSGGLCPPPHRPPTIDVATQEHWDMLCLSAAVALVSLPKRVLPLRVYGTTERSHLQGIRHEAKQRLACITPSLRPLVERVLMDGERCPARRLLDQVSAFPLVRLPDWVHRTLAIITALRSAAKQDNVEQEMIRQSRGIRALPEAGAPFLAHQINTMLSSNATPELARFAAFFMGRIAACCPTAATDGLDALFQHTKHVLPTTMAPEFAAYLYSSCGAMAAQHLAAHASLAMHSDDCEDARAAAALALFSLNTMPMSALTAAILKQAVRALKARAANASEVLSVFLAHGIMLSQRLLSLLGHVASESKSQVVWTSVLAAVNKGLLMRPALVTPVFCRRVHETLLQPAMATTLALLIERTTSADRVTQHAGGETDTSVGVAEQRALLLTASQLVLVMCETMGRDTALCSLLPSVRCLMEPFLVVQSWEDTDRAKAKAQRNEEVQQEQTHMHQVGAEEIVSSSTGHMGEGVCGHVEGEAVAAAKQHGGRRGSGSSNGAGNGNGHNNVAQAQLPLSDQGRAVAADSADADAAAVRRSRRMATACTPTLAAGIYQQLCQRLGQHQLRASLPHHAVLEKIMYDHLEEAGESVVPNLRSYREHHDHHHHHHHHHTQSHKHQQLHLRDAQPQHGRAKDEAEHDSATPPGAQRSGAFAVVRSTNSSSGTRGAIGGDGWGDGNDGAPVTSSDSTSSASASGSARPYRAHGVGASGVEMNQAGRTESAIHPGAEISASPRTGPGSAAQATLARGRAVPPPLPFQRTYAASPPPETSSSSTSLSMNRAGTPAAREHKRGGGGSGGRSAGSQRSGSLGRRPAAGSSTTGNTINKGDDDVFWFSMLQARWERDGVPRGGGTTATASTAKPPAELRARTLRGHSHRVRSLCTLGMWGEVVASAGRDRTVRLWRLLSPKGMEDDNVPDHSPFTPASARGGRVDGVAGGGLEARDVGHTASPRLPGGVGLRDSMRRITRDVFTPTRSAALFSKRGRLGSVGGSGKRGSSTDSAEEDGGEQLLSTQQGGGSGSGNGGGGGGGGEVPVLGFGTGEQQFAYEQHRRSVTAVAAAPWADRVVSCDATQVHVWSPQTGKAETVLPFAGAELQCMLPSPAQGVLYLGHSDAGVSCLDPRCKDIAFTWKVLPDTYAEYRDSVTALCLMEGGTQLVCGTYGGRLGVLDARVGDIVGGWAAHREEASIQCLQDAGRGHVLVAAGHKCTVMSPDHKVLSTLPTGDHTATALADMGDGGVVAVNGSSKLYYMPGVGGGSGAGAGSGSAFGGVADPYPSRVDVWRPPGIRGVLSTSITPALDNAVCVLGCDSGSLRVLPAPGFCFDVDEDV